MEYIRLGASGLKVSRIALGCMSFGDPSKGRPWTLDDDAAEPVFRQAVELGITFWDTANVYSQGTSEEITGRALREYTRRDDIVLATKVFWPMHSGPGGGGLSRKAILEQIDGSLARLGTDYIDLYQIYRFDPDVPVEKTRRRCTTWSRPARPATSVPPPCGPGGSPRCSTPPASTAGPGSCPCKTSTACCSAKKNARCSACSRIRAWPASRGARSLRET
jgi:Aldo/keto reductase family